MKTVPWYRKEAIEPIPVPILGPDILDPRDYVQIKDYTREKLAAAKALAAEAEGEISADETREEQEA